MSRIEALKERYDLLTYVEGIVQKPGKVAGNWVSYRCPIHDDHTNSLGVKKDGTGWYCFAEQRGGDLVDFVAALHGVGISEAIRLLERDTPAPIIKRDRTPIPVTPLDLGAVRRCAGRYEASLPYMASRAVGTSMVQEALVGSDIRRYTVPELDWVIDTPYVAMPNIFMDKVRAVKLRRDERRVDDLMEMIDVTIIQKATEILGAPSEGKLRDFLFGSRFRQWTGSKDGKVYGADLLACWDKVEEKVISNRLSYVLIVEGEICALSLRDAGYPAVAIKYHKDVDFTNIFENVFTPWIVADNDTDKQNGGKTFNPGRDNAMKIWRALGQRGRVIFPPAPFSDSNDVVVAGEAGRWLEEFGITRMNEVAMKAACP